MKDKKKHGNTVAHRIRKAIKNAPKEYLPKEQADKIESFLVEYYSPYSRRRDLPPDVAQTVNADCDAVVARVQAWERLNWVAIPIFLSAVGYVCVRIVGLLTEMNQYGKESSFLSLALFSIMLAILAYLGTALLAFFTRLIYTYTYVAWILEGVLRRAGLTLGHRYVEHVFVGLTPNLVAQHPLPGMTALLFKVYRVAFLVGTVLALSSVVVYATYRLFL